MDAELQQRAVEYGALGERPDVAKLNVLAMPHWEKRKSLLLRRLAARGVSTRTVPWTMERACSAHYGWGSYCEPIRGHSTWLGLVLRRVTMLCTVHHSWGLHRKPWAPMYAPSEQASVVSVCCGLDGRLWLPLLCRGRHGA